MRLGRSSNPTISDKQLNRIARAGSLSNSEAMTISGTLNKSVIMFAILIITAYIGFNYSAGSAGMIWGGLIGGFILAIITTVKPQYAPYTAPAYATFEGILLGAVSAYYNAFFDGIIIQAVGLTMSIFFIMLILYRSQVIRATPKFKRGIIIATSGVVFFYLLNLVASLFGAGLSFHKLGGIGIIIQLVIVGIASLNLILDFDMIEKGAENNLPKYAEWYSAFSITVTLVWLYLEILRLLSLISGND